MSEKRIKPFIVPVFIPHSGCPHRCAFCEQKKITSQREPVRKDFVKGVLEEAIRSKGFHPDRLPEVAFFGGTFTMLPLDRMTELLGAVRPYLDGGLFHSIRVSTRPDAIDVERLDLLWRNGVRTVELGVQSMDDEVLHLSRRGHQAEDVVTAVKLLKRHRFRVGVQLMPGLPGDSEERFLSTVEAVIALGPDLVRLYPAVVIRGTELFTLFREGVYTPLSLQEAVDLCAEACMRFESVGVRVIRIGLMNAPGLPKEIAGGPWHPAFGLLVRSAIYHRAIIPDLPPRGAVEGMTIRVPERDIPLLRGFRNEGLARLEEITGARVMGIRADATVPRGKIELEPGKNSGSNRKDQAKNGRVVRA